MLTSRQTGVCVCESEYEGGFLTLYMDVNKLFSQTFWENTVANNLKKRCVEETQKSKIRS